MLGQNINRFRREAGLTQTQLGERIPVTRQTISRWETGESMPERSHLLALANALGVTEGQLFEQPATAAAAPATAPVTPPAAPEREADHG